MTKEEKNKFADYWLNAAQAEHSSIASFSQVILELSTFGAPSNLLELATSAMQDEIRHTKIAVSLVKIATNKEYEINNLPLTNLPLRNKEQFRKANHRDAIINEARSADELYKYADECLKKNRIELAKVITEIADDETRHADLGHKIEEWLVSTENNN